MGWPTEASSRFGTAACHTLPYIAIPIQTTHVPLHRSTYSNIRAGYISFGQRHLKRIDGLSSAPQSTTHQSFIFMLLLCFQPDSLGGKIEQADPWHHHKELLRKKLSSYPFHVFFSQRSVIECKVRGPKEVD